MIFQHPAEMKDPDNYSTGFSSTWHWDINLLLDLYRSLNYGLDIITDMGAMMQNILNTYSYRKTNLHFDLMLVKWAVVNLFNQYLEVTI